MRPLLPALLSLGLFACSSRSGTLEPNDAGDASRADAGDATSMDAGPPPSRDCVASGGVCASYGPSPTSICGVSERLDDSLLCPQQGPFPSACCVPLSCDQRDGTCTLPGAPCPDGLLVAPKGCEQSGAQSQCCLPPPECTRRGGTCVPGGNCAAALGPTYHPVYEAPEVLCPPAPAGESGPACCVQKALDACDQAGGVCLDSMSGCPSTFNARCDRPNVGGVTWVCCK